MARRVGLDSIPQDVDLFAVAFTVAGGAQRRLDLEMKLAETLVLMLKDSRGNPVAGEVRIRYRRLDGSRRGINASLLADDEGHAVFRRLMPGRHKLWSRVSGIGHKDVETLIRAGRNEVSIVLE